MSEPTPGPWATRFIYRMIRRVRESPGDLLIASDPANDWAAPDLLEACRATLDGFALLIASDDLTDDERRQVAMLRAAIAKAEGDGVDNG